MGTAGKQTSLFAAKPWHAVNTDQWTWHADVPKLLASLDSRGSAEGALRQQLQRTFSLLAGELHSQMCRFGYRLRFYFENLVHGVLCVRPADADAGKASKKPAANDSKAGKESKKEPGSEQQAPKRKRGGKSVGGASKKPVKAIASVA